MQWSVAVAGPPCRFLVFCHLALGEHEFEHAAQLEIDARAKAIQFPAGPAGLLEPALSARRLPPRDEYTRRASRRSAATSSCTPTASAAAAPMRLCGPAPTNEFVFAVVGSMTDPQRAERLAQQLCRPASMRRRCRRRRPATGATLPVASASRARDGDAGAGAIDTILPWLVHDAMVHLTRAARTRAIYRRRLGHP